MTISAIAAGFDVAPDDIANEILPGFAAGVSVDVMLGPCLHRSGLDGLSGLCAKSAAKAKLDRQSVSDQGAGSRRLNSPDMDRLVLQEPAELKAVSAMPNPVVTRFAPSPTGYLHIGGARTALFNWLYARHTGGRMLLRIEDTDRERSTDAAIAAILDGLTWLGLDWDGEPVHQFARAARHREVAEAAALPRARPIAAYDTAEELNEMRAMARAEGRSARYDGRWRDRDPSEAPAGVAPSIRIKAPQDGETVIDDSVQGRVAFPNDDLDDFVILRSDGTPTYMLAVVVDDHDMGVTQIIRGDDHLTNAARQKILYDALGWPLPEMAHIPLIHGPDGAKLSKRHGALGVDAYRAMGYLPEAMRNYLVRLGWSHGDDEIMSTDEMIDWFDIDGIGRGAARFDFAKLESLNAHYIGQRTTRRCWRRCSTNCRICRAATAFRAKLDADRLHRLASAMPAPQGAGQDAGRPDGARRVHRRRAAARASTTRRRRCSTEDARAMLGRLIPPASRRSTTGRRRTLEAAVKAFAESDGAEARQGGAAAARRADRNGPPRRHFRGAGNPRPRGISGAASPIRRG